MNKSLPYYISIFFLTTIISVSVNAQTHSVAREWNELLLTSIRGDFARPTIHARNLHHVSVAMYDAWAAYEPDIDTYLLGKTVHGFTSPYTPVGAPTDIRAAREEALSYAVYRVLQHRFLYSPDAVVSLASYDDLMDDLGYDKTYTDTDYTNNNPAALGNYIAEQVINYGLQDGSNEVNSYVNQYYAPVNNPLVTYDSGNPNMTDPNRWQPLTLDFFIDQSGNPIPINTPEFLSPEWGNVSPFAMGNEDKTVYNRDGSDYLVYHDPGMPPLLDTTGVDASENYIWGFSLVSAWSSHLDPADGVMWDISPASIGNIQDYPTSFDDYDSFYDLENGGDTSIGHSINPYTGMPYTPQIVPRADYTRVLAEFWADGPESETPPGHWFTILNYVNDHSLFEKKYRGQGEIMDDLEWDVKAYFMMGGAMHDCAVSAWGIKGWYDYPRPMSAIRYMGDQGQSTFTQYSNYNPNGLPIIDDFIEIVLPGDPLAGSSFEHVGKIKIYAWKGPDYISDPETDVAGVDWILAEDWHPYQRPTFVTPPFAGYISGHSTYSSAAAQVMETLTGDAFFPGGMGEFNAAQNEFLVFEEGPSQDITLQWATYKDASDQTSLSRIWGGIHPPADDIPGRFIGQDIGNDVIEFAELLFVRDNDMDGSFDYVDCDDNDNSIYPNAPEICDGKDNDCNGTIDEGLTVFTYFQDADNDGFGDENVSLDTCLTVEPVGYVSNNQDCDDSNSDINPNEIDIQDNGIDEDCSGADSNSVAVDDIMTKFNLSCFPNPVKDYLNIDGNYSGTLKFEIFNMQGQLVQEVQEEFNSNYQLNMLGNPRGIYILRISDNEGKTGSFKFALLEE
ncbi:MAG: MopE-related protein [Saprospiraceae bacterium]